MLWRELPFWNGTPYAFRGQLDALPGPRASFVLCVVVVWCGLASAGGWCVGLGSPVCCRVVVVLRVLVARARVIFVCPRRVRPRPLPLLVALSVCPFSFVLAVSPPFGLLPSAVCCLPLLPF